MDADFDRAPMWERVVAGFLFFFTSPFVIAIYHKIRKTYGVDPIYRQKRIGQHGREIEVLKFRTLRLDAHAIEKEDHMEEGEQRENDRRVLGPFAEGLRIHRLDEWLSLWSVILGNRGITLIGPRPQQPKEREKWFESHQKLIITRELVLPGITGAAQVKKDGNLSPKKFEFDEEFVKNHNLWKKLHILLKTVHVIWKGNGL